MQPDCIGYFDYAVTAMTNLDLLQKSRTAKRAARNVPCGASSALGFHSADAHSRGHGRPAEFPADELTFVENWEEDPKATSVPAAAMLAGWIDGDSATGRMKVEGRADGQWTAVRQTGLPIRK